MAALLRFTAAVAASIVLYLVLVAGLERRLTWGELVPLIERKVAHAQSLPGPRLLVFAGSNGRYSHRCATLAQATGWPCSNLSLAVGVGLDFQLQRFEPLLRPGDVLYLPLEYSQYRVGRDEMTAGAENMLLVHHFRDQLAGLPWERQVRAWASFDLGYLVHAGLETVLAWRGTKRRTGLDTLSPEGDERGHDDAAAQPYRAALARARTDTEALPGDSHALQVLTGFLARQRARGVRVVGGLPTTPIGMGPGAPSIARLQALFVREGHAFVVLPSKSQYPLDCFFDTLYHLRERCQITHTQALGEALLPLLPPRPAAVAHAP